MSVTLASIFVLMFSSASWSIFTSSNNSGDAGCLYLSLEAGGFGFLLVSTGSKAMNSSSSLSAVSSSSSCLALLPAGLGVAISTSSTSSSVD